MMPQTVAVESTTVRDERRNTAVKVEKTLKRVEFSSLRGEKVREIGCNEARHRREIRSSQ